MLRGKEILDNSKGLSVSLYTKENEVKHQAGKKIFTTCNEITISKESL